MAGNINKPKTGKSVFRRVIHWLHLWLGLGSGLVVLVVSITGCIYAFEKEIRDITQPYQFVTPRQLPFLPPSRLTAIARRHAFEGLPDTGEHKIKSIHYGSRNKAAIAAYQSKENGYTMIYLDPYTGAVLKEKILEQDFFRIILAGHFYLWLPKEIGQPVVAGAVLVFVVLLITGFIMWLPKNLKKANVDKSFRIKWGARFKRLNYDLHNVLGFYVLSIALILALTGLVWGFEWFSRSSYWITSGGKPLPGKDSPVSDTLQIAGRVDTSPPIDRLWRKLRPAGGNEMGSLQFQLPMSQTDIIAVNENSMEGTYYKRQFTCYDQYTLELLPATGIYAKPFEKSGFADRLRRMNYDIHVGAVLGLPGKLLAFFASFICATLPASGFIIWWGKKKKSSGGRKTTRQIVQKEQRDRKRTGKMLVLHEQK